MESGGTHREVEIMKVLIRENEVEVSLTHLIARKR